MTTSPAPSPAPAAAVALPAASPRRRFHIDNRYLAPILVTIVLLVGQIAFGFLESWSRTALAISTSILVEMVLARLFTGQWPHLASAYVSGISVGMLVRSPEFWPYALCSAIAIVSKYVIRVDGRHIWNPSNLGIVAMLVLASDTVASLSVQWGNNLLPMAVVWCFGAVIVHRLGRLHITATYVTSFIAFSLVRAAVTGHPWPAEVAPITGPMYQLFIFFMITDPKTTVHPKWAQCLVAFLVAAVEAVFRLLQFVHAPYYALFVVGPLANLVEIVLARRAASRNPSCPSPSNRRSSRIPKEILPMAERNVIANQKSILKNQADILANQKAIQANQGRILANQGKLDRVLRNQDVMKANQKRILANQKRLLAR